MRGNYRLRGKASAQYVPPAKYGKAMRQVRALHAQSRRKAGDLHDLERDCKRGAVVVDRQVKRLDVVLVPSRWPSDDAPKARVVKRVLSYYAWIKRTRKYPEAYIENYHKDQRLVVQVFGDETQTAYWLDSCKPVVKW